MTDPISDMLARIRNALLVNKTEVLVPRSKIKFAIAKILEKEGYVAQVKEVTERKFPMIRIVLRYKEDRSSAIKMIKRISKPGCRIYRPSGELPYVLSDFGIAIISTSNGLMTNKEARARRLGGEIICEVS